MFEVKEPGMPIIKIEVEHMRHSLSQALSEYQIKMDEYVNEAIEKFCRPDNLSAIVEAKAQDELKRAVEECIEGFFRYGPGRKAVLEATVDRMNQLLQYMNKKEKPDDPKSPS